MTFPITAVLIFAYLFALEAAQSPDSTATMIGSVVPPTLRLVMLARLAIRAVPLW